MCIVSEPVNTIEIEADDGGGFRIKPDNCCNCDCHKPEKQKIAIHYMYAGYFEIAGMGYHDGFPLEMESFEKIIESFEKSKSSFDPIWVSEWITKENGICWSGHARRIVAYKDKENLVLHMQERGGLSFPTRVNPNSRQLALTISDFKRVASVIANY